MDKSERRKKLHVAKVAKVSKCGKKRPLHTPLANAWLKVNLASSVQTIRLGTECSGLEAVMVAMEKMGLMDQTQLKFICEKDAAARRLTLSHASPSIVYEDITTRPVERMPVCDVYVAGFPCQPWSTAGLSEGTDDRQGRGRIFPHIHNYIHVKAPKCFLLENVKGMTTGTHKDAFANVLKSLRDGLHNKYIVSWRVLNTADFGLPQNRPRLYIIGMRRDALQDGLQFLWPRPLGCVPLDSILEVAVKCEDHQPKVGTIAHTNLRMFLDRLQEKAEPPSGLAALDIFASKNRATQSRSPMVGLIPCLTRTRAGSGGYWITGIDRLLTTREMLRLQGLPDHFTELAERANVSDRQLRQMIGNAMSVNVLVTILSRLLPAVGLA
jgi:DNA (cytosine-5)-methyltransferase 1